MQSDEDILQGLRRFLKDQLLRPVVGWESLFEVPEEAVILVSTDLSYLNFPQLSDTLDQAVVVSRNRVIVTVFPHSSTSRLRDILLEWNHRNPRNVVRKITSHACTLLFKLHVELILVELRLPFELCRVDTKRSKPSLRARGSP